MKHCKKFEDYAILIDKIRGYKKELNDLEQAINRAVDEGIAEERLKDFLLPHKSEVVGMLLTEWNEEEYIKGVMEDSEGRGIQIGEKKGQDKMGKLMCILAENGDIETIKRVSMDETYREEMYRKYDID